MHKKVSVGVTISLMLISAALATSIAVMITWRQLSLSITDFSERQAIYDKLGAIDQKVRAEYFGKIDQETLLDNLGDAYIAALGDRFSDYLSAEEYSRQTLENEGKSVGIGITVTSDENGYLKVVKVETGGPAKTAGVQTGDLIVTVDGKDTAELGYDAAISKLVGEVNTICKFSVQRGGKTIPFEIKRVEFESVSIVSRKIGSLGYIKISAFHDNTVEQFKAALDKLIDEDVSGLIFDLRFNGGGTLDSVSKMLDILVPKGTIVSATYKDGKTEVLHKSDSSEVKLPMAVLVNSGTASASELFAAALRDYDKGVLVGTKTYGKGVMQRTYKLDDGSAVRLTVAKFNPPSGKNFNDVGLSPDVEVALTEEQTQNFDQLTDETDPQIQAAVAELMK